jgi:hypothetical protein
MGNLAQPTQRFAEKEIVLQVLGEAQNPLLQNRCGWL